MEMPNELWVIVRSTGEYSDRSEDPIRFCLSEADAQRAVDLASIEAQRDADKKPQYKRKSTHRYQFENGEWLPESVDFMHPDVRSRAARFMPLPDVDAIRAQNDAWSEEYNEACRALNHVDPRGSWSGDSYSYERVTLWPNPRARHGD